MATQKSPKNECWIVTGGAGFIGSNFVRMARRLRRAQVVTFDLLTYAGNLANLDDLKDDPYHVFVRGDIRDRNAVFELFSRYQPTGLYHFAAESHVDRSIENPEAFIETNVTGTFTLLDEALRYHRGTGSEKGFRFLHVSTDEVYGSLDPSDPPFTERTPYAPNSPYAASKASSDHLARAYVHTYGLPLITTNCSNNYGPWQFPEKLIPTIILSALEARPIPVYGDGLNIRDWIFVEDHCEGVMAAFDKGQTGETYALGASNPRTNREVVATILDALDRIHPSPDGRSYKRLVTFVPDRPGHDRRYEIDATKARKELFWKPSHTFEQAMEITIRWFLAHETWWTDLRARYDGSRQGTGRNNHAGRRR